MSKQKKIEVTEYNPEWPAIFEEEKSIILDALGDNCVAIHHVGSTSVPRLIAKPKIDIIAIANDRKKAITDLEKVGYSYDGEWNIKPIAKRDFCKGVLQNYKKSVEIYQKKVF